MGGNGEKYKLPALARSFGELIYTMMFTRDEGGRKARGGAAHGASAQKKRGKRGV